MIKKVFRITILLVSVMAIASCASTSAETNAVEEPSADMSGGSSGEINASSDVPSGELPVEVQLLIGTLELEGTELAVDAEQAAELLPLWKAYRSLVNSDTAASAEIATVVSQIQITMTTSQLEQIAAMEIGPDRMLSLVQELGLMPEGFPSSDEVPEGFRPGGDFPRGAFPGEDVPGSGVPRGFGEGGFGQDLDPEQRATLQAQREGGGLRNRMALILIDPVIELLEGRAGSF